VVRKFELTRRAFLEFTLAVPVWLALPSGLVCAATLRVTGQRHWSAPDHTRLVFELDAPAQFATRAYSDPDRVVLEIHNAQHRDGDLEIVVDDGLIKRISFKNLPDSLLVRVELVRAADFSAFPLAPNAGGERHRIVLDVRKRLTAAEQAAQDRDTESVRKSGDVVVAVDAGHGGNDPGCSGHRVVEKDVALAVAHLTAAAITRKPRLRAVLTRDRDYFIPLGRRPEIARRFDAGAFVSIHLNSAASPEASGSEVFFLSMKGAADKAARELIDRENAADLVGGVPPGEAATPVLNILMNMKQNQALRESERLGEIVLDKLATLPSNDSRGLKQGPLAVLKSITCPSVLVELGFVTNKRDARRMLDPDGQRRYAALIADGVAEFLE